MDSIYLKLSLVALGGVLGSLARYQLGRILSEKYSTTFPMGTFIINISGAILLGVVSSPAVGNNAYTLLGDGFLGAYTTFSTFMYEGFNLFQDNERLNAFLYILLSLILGFIGYFIGLKLGNLL